MVTHSVSYLDVCDQMLLVAPGGKTAFCGPPDQVESAMGTRNWADIFAKVGADPDEANRRFKERNQQSSRPPTPESPADLGEPPQTDLLRQFSTIARRQVRLVVSDRGYTIFLAILPFLIGVLSLTVKGPHRASVRPTRWGDAPNAAAARSWCCSTSAPCSWAPR